MNQACMLLGPTPKTSGVRDLLSARGIDTRLIAQGVEVDRFASFCCELRPRVVVLYCQNIPDYGVSIARALRERFDREIALFGLFDSHGDLNKGTRTMEKAGVDTFISCPMPAAKVAEEVMSRWYGDMKKPAKVPTVSKSPPSAAPPPQSVKASRPIPQTRPRLPTPAPAKPIPSTLPAQQTAPVPPKAPAVPPAPTKVAKGGIIHNPPLTGKPVVWNIVGKHDQVLYIDPRRVRPLPGQPREEDSPGFSKESIAELGNSMKEHGQMESVVVCPVVDDPLFDAQLVDGERRQRASLAVGIMLRAAVREDVTPQDVEDLYLLSVIGNTSKVPPTMKEYILIVRQLRGPRYNFTLARTASAIGCHLSWVSQLESLGRLEPQVQELLIVDSAQGRKHCGMGRITPPIALQLVDLEPEMQRELAQHIIQHKLNYGQTKRHVLQVRRQLGLLRTTPGRGRSRLIEQFRALGTLTARNTDAYGVYSDMSLTELERLGNSHSLEERNAACKNLRALAASLNELADRIDEI